MPRKFRNIDEDEEDDEDDGTQGYQPAGRTLKKTRTVLQHEKLPAYDQLFLDLCDAEAVLPLQGKAERHRAMHNVAQARRSKIQIEQQVMLSLLK